MFNKILPSGDRVYHHQMNPNSILNDEDSRKSYVLSNNGMCCSSQSLASAAGVKILNQGGSAADAAVAMAAVLNVVEPCSTGVGIIIVLSDTVE